MPGQRPMWLPGNKFFISKQKAGSGFTRCQLFCISTPTHAYFLRKAPAAGAGKGDFCDRLDPNSHRAVWRSRRFCAYFPGKYLSANSKRSIAHLQRISYHAHQHAPLAGYFRRYLWQPRRGIGAILDWNPCKRRTVMQVLPRVWSPFRSAGRGCTPHLGPVCQPGG